MTLGAEGTQIKLILEKRRNCDKIESGEEGTPIKLKPEQKEHQSLLCVEQQSTVLYETWIRRNSNKPDNGEEGTVIKLSGEGALIKLRPEKKEL